MKFEKVDWILVAGLGLIAVGLGWAMKAGEGSSEVVVEKASSEVTVSSDVESQLMVMIDVSGEVVNPGVYELISGVRMVEVLARAGGLGPKADRNWVSQNINLASIVADGTKIYIPRVGEAGRIETVGAVSGVGIVSLNRGSQQDLESLPGVGPSLAGKIIEYRERNGGFKDVREIMLVSGVGEKMWEKIKDRVSL